jgi:glutamate racemase
MNKAPLGVFDSGIGGLTVARALFERLPREAVIYFGDTARVPYGPKSPDTVRRYSAEILAFLLKRGVKAVVVACNTSTAHALTDLKERSPVPVVGVIEPGARAAVAATKTGVIGVIGTAGTIASGAYERAIKALRPDARVHGQACPLFVPLVEEGWFEHPAAELIAREYLEPLKRAKVDVLVLGCTHYPLLKHTIAEVAAQLSGRVIPVVDSAEATAAAVLAWIDEERIAPAASAPFAGDELQLLVTDLPKSFASMAEQMLGAGAPSVTQVDLGPA